MNPPDRLSSEADLLTDVLAVYRASPVNDQTMFKALVGDWAGLSAAHRALVYKIADALRSAAAWRRVQGGVLVPRNIGTDGEGA